MGSCGIWKLETYRVSQKVLHKLHIFGVNKICLIVPFLPCAEGVKMVSVFTSPNGIDIWFAVFGSAAVPGCDGLCVG